MLVFCVKLLLVTLEVLSQRVVEYVRKYSEKIEIVPEYLLWSQEELFDDKTNTQKSRDTVPLKEHHRLIFNLLIPGLQLVLVYSPFWCCDV